MIEGDFLADSDDWTAERESVERWSLPSVVGHSTTRSRSIASGAPAGFASRLDPGAAAFLAGCRGIEKSAASAAVRSLLVFGVSSVVDHEIRRMVVDDARFLFPQILPRVVDRLSKGRGDLLREWSTRGGPTTMGIGALVLLALKHAISAGCPLTRNFLLERFEDGYLDYLEGGGPSACLNELATVYRNRAAHSMARFDVDEYRRVCRLALGADSVDRWLASGADNDASDPASSILDHHLRFRKSPTPNEFGSESAAALGLTARALDGTGEFDLEVECRWGDDRWKLPPENRRSRARILSWTRGTPVDVTVTASRGAPIVWVFCEADGVVVGRQVECLTLDKGRSKFRFAPTQRSEKVQSLVVVAVTKDRCADSSPTTSTTIWSDAALYRILMNSPTSAFAAVAFKFQS